MAASDPRIGLMVMILCVILDISRSEAGEQCCMKYMDIKRLCIFWCFDEGPWSVMCCRMNGCGVVVVHASYWWRRSRFSKHEPVTPIGLRGLLYDGESVAE